MGQVRLRRLDARRARRGREVNTHQTSIIDQIADEWDELRDENIRLKNRIKLLEEYETRLSAVMPIDFKDWHQNSKAEWPEVAASVISSQRERLNERDELRQ